MTPIFFASNPARHAWLLVVLACSESAPSAPPRPTRSLPTPAAAAASTGSTAPWPDDVVSLQQSVDAFRDYESCVSGLRARLPVEIAELLDDLQYEAVAEDACRGLDAVRRKDVSVCDELSTATLRSGCVLRVAIVAADPDLCPIGVGNEGRDPLCLAWAMRQTGACQGVPRWERARCQAVINNNEESCRRDRNPARCAGQVQRLGPLMGEVHDSRAHPTSFHLVVQDEDGTEIKNVDASAQVDNGIYIQVDDCETTATIVARTNGLRRSDLELSLTPRGLLGSIVIDGLRRSLNEGTATPTILSAARGAPLETTLRATLQLNGRRHTVVGTLQTFVRDRDALAPSCRAPTK